MSPAAKFSELLKPIKIGKLELKNRLVMAPILSRTATDEGYVTDRMIECYSFRARNGLGMIIIEAIITDASHGLITRNLVIDDDRFIPKLRELTSEIHRSGAKITAQLLSPHLLKFPPNNERLQAGPSTVDMPDSHGGPPIPLREMSVDQINMIESRFAAAAVRAKKAGFDAIEIHGAHGYLLPRFISPALNKRTDMYGGSPENRIRFLAEIIQAVKEATGGDFPVWCRINAVELHIPGGVTIEETQKVCPIIQEAGSDAIHVSAPFSWLTPRAGYVDWAISIKKVFKGPVITVGNLDLELGEQIIKEGKADLIAIGKPLLADGEMVSKTLKGQQEDVVPCIRCNECHIHPSGTAEVVCSVNPTLYREAEHLKPAPKTKRILVIGSGPGGMEAAVIAARRGHSVTLFEKEERLGGQLWAAAKLSYKEPIFTLGKYFEKQLRKLSVDVRTGSEVTPEIVHQMKPDTVIVVTGICPFTPEIKGIRGDNVVLAQDVFEEKVSVGDNVVVIGAERVGCEVAEFLADIGKKVTVMRQGEKIAGDSPIQYQFFICNRLANKDVNMMPGVRYREIRDNGILVIDSQGNLITASADSIVIAAGSRSNDKLFRLLKEKHPDVHCVGDCIEPRDIKAAISEGYEIASRL